jgi:adenine-specific DNA-methyltransferase
LEKICYISYGLRPNADDRFWQGEFTTEDCLSPLKDRNHPKPFLQGKNVDKWCITERQYLEWGTSRAPKKFARPTFPQLYEVPEKLVAVKVSPTPKVAYDTEKHFHSDGLCSMVPWHYLEGVVNRSISKTAKYKWQAPDGNREEREKVSQKFHLKYVLAVINSTFTQEWLTGSRRNKLQLYPDDWKLLPIAPIPMERQMEFVRLADAILAEFKQHGCPLTSEANQKVNQLEKEIDKRVEKLYKVNGQG